MTEKERRGREIFASLPPEFNVAPFWDGYSKIDYEKLADWEATQRRAQEPFDPVDEGKRKNLALRMWQRIWGKH